MTASTAIFLALSHSAPALLQPFHHLIEIGIPRAKTSRQPVSTAFSDRLSIRQYFELAGLAMCNHRFSSEPLFNKGRETRDLGFVVLSRRAGTYLNFHSISPEWFDVASRP